MPPLNTLTAEKILSDIRPMLDNGADVIESLIEYAEKNNIEVELIGEIIKRSPILKAKVQENAENLNMMAEKTVKLPI